MQEVQMRPTGVLRVLEDAVELVGADGDAQGREVSEDLLTPGRPAQRRLGGLLWFHRGLPRIRAGADSRWSVVGRWLRRADWDRALRAGGRRVRRARVSAWRR